MEKLKRKLRSRSGVSIFYALAFFLVASMVAVVVLDASVTATKRVRTQQQTQQAALTLASGGKLLREMLTQSSVTIEQTFQTEADGVTPLLDDEGNPVPGPDSYTGAGPLGPVLERSVEKVTEYHAAFDSSNDNLVNRDIVITVEGDDVEGVFSEVTLTFTMFKENEGRKYYLCGTITALPDTQGQLTMEAYVEGLVDEDTYPKILRWQTPVLKGGG